MAIRGERFLRRSLQTTLYAAIERFISDHVVPEIERGSVRADKDALLIKAEDIIDRAISRFFRDLENHNINSIEELDDVPELVENLMDRIQQDLIGNAEDLQED